MLANFVQETANAPGTAATINLGGAAAGRLPFVPTFASGTVVFYGMDDGTLAEMGIGTVTAGSPNTLARTTVLWNSAGTTARINFLGSVRVYNAVPAERGIFLRSDGTVQNATATGSALFRAADAAAARTAIGATTTGSAVLTAADAAAARAAIAAVPAGAITVSGLTMTTARLLGRTTGATGAVEEISVGAGLSLSSGVLTSPPDAPTPTTSASVGQWAAISPASGSAAVLPSGGTWAWFAVSVFLGTTNNDLNGSAGVSAGGTTIRAAGADLMHRGFAWRIA